MPNQVNQSNLAYRPEIDGLRAIAVMSVILYHARMPFLYSQPFQGGFIGVDIFFVISGYLISRIVLSELRKTDSLDIRRFYERRARRILPALYVVICFSIPCAWILLLPSALVEYAQSVLAALFFVSNLFFYEKGIEYGATEALLRPLLHTWSLGVEAQFYLFFPLVAAVLWAYSRKWFLRFLLGASLVSWSVAVVLANVDSDRVFYSLGARVWEFGLGALIAYRELGSKGGSYRYVEKILPSLGLAIIGYSIWLFDDSLPFRISALIFPMIGVCSIIAFASQDELVGRILAWKPLAGLGLISYSAYLWHFPVLALARSFGEPPTAIKVALIVLITLLATVTFFLVEQPCRRRGVVRLGALLSIGMVTVLLLVVGALFSIHSDGFPDRFSLAPLRLAEFNRDNRYLQQASWKRSRDRINLQPTFAKVPRRVLVVGNSHAKDIFNALDTNRAVFPTIDFLPGQDGYDFELACFDEGVSEFSSIRERFYTSRAFEEATTVLVSTDWRLKNHCQKRRQNWPCSSDFVGVKFLIDRSKASGKKVVLMGQSPRFNWGKAQKLQTMADVVVSELQEGDRLREIELVSLKEIIDTRLFESLLWERSKGVWTRLSKISREYQVPLYDKFPLACNAEQKRCDGLTELGAKTFFDDSHYTVEGARLFGERLAGDPNFVKLLQ